ncbi:MAG TPA: MFS transporter [Chloroflexota bacterium]|nr:MFS transporter [Chloroflexota bacterium]
MTSGADEQLLSRGEAWALVGCQPLAQLSNMALLPSLGAMRADLDLSYVELGWVVASFGVARLVVDLPAGNLASRWNPRTLLIAAFALSAGASTLGVLAANAWQIATVRLLIGAGSSVAQAMILAWLVGGAGRVERGRVMARSEAFFSLSGLFIPALGGLLAGSLGWRVAFVLGALAALIGLVAIVGGTRSGSAARAVGLSTPSTPSKDPPNVSWRELRGGGSVLLAAYLATFVVFYCRNGMLNAVVPVLGTEALGIEPARIGLLFSAINAVGIGAVLLGGRWADRFGRYRVMLPALALFTIAQALLLMVVDPLTYVLVGVMQGVAQFVNPIPTTVMGDALPPHMRARGIAVYRTVCDVAILSAPASMGLALQVAGFPAAEVVNVSVCLLVLVTCAALYWRRPKHNRQYST